MSYPLTKFIRQPGGFSHGRCTPQPWDGASPIACDCYICRNDGRPQYAVIGFLNFAGSTNNDCACLNRDNTFFNPDQPTSGPNSVYSGGAFQGWQLDYVGTFQGAAANVDPLATPSTGVFCLFAGALHPSLAGLEGAHGSWAQVALGWTQNVGIYVYAEFGDPPGSTGIYPYYTWLKTGLPGAPGNVLCHDDGAAAGAVNSVGGMLAQLTGGQSSLGTFNTEFFSASTVGGSGKNYLCGPAVTGQSQPTATCFVRFVGSTKIAPPCCCGEPGGVKNCFWACIKDSACAPATPNVLLCDAGGGLFTGDDGSGFSGKLGYDPGSGTWLLCYSCDGFATQKCQTLDGTAEPQITMSGGVATVSKTPPCGSNCELTCCQGAMPADLDCELNFTGSFAPCPALAAALNQPFALTGNGCTFDGGTTVNCVCAVADGVGCCSIGQPLTSAHVAIQAVVAVDPGGQKCTWTLRVEWGAQGEACGDNNTKGLYLFVFNFSSDPQPIGSDCSSLPALHCITDGGCPDLSPTIAPSQLV